MRILTQVTPDLALMAIHCSAYSNLFLNLTEEGDTNLLSNVTHYVLIGSKR
jgi:hypothetical protein